MDRIEERGKLKEVDVWIQCTQRGLDCILDDNDGEVNHINSTDPAPRVWLESDGNSQPRQWALKEIPRERLVHFFVQRG